jgi:protein Mpv17
LEIVARVGCDQLIFAPTNLLVFLTSMAVMEGKDPKEKLDKTYKPVLQRNFMVWPFVQAVNCKFSVLGKYSTALNHSLTLITL